MDILSQNAALNTSASAYFTQAWYAHVISGFVIAGLNKHTKVYFTTIVL
jgi:hypothetical protein